jgi:D-alanine-D-alanine ligase
MAMDKGYTKTLVRAAGILTPDWVRICPAPEDADRKAAELPLPCVVKTPNEAPPSACTSAVTAPRCAAR